MKVDYGSGETYTVSAKSFIKTFADKCEKMFLSEKELDDHFIQNHVDKDYSSKLIKHTQSVLSELH